MQIRNLVLILLFSSSLSVFSSEFSAMTFNTQNLFDTLDDPKKNDKAYLPIELKQSEKHINSCQFIRVKAWKDECLYLDWNEDTKNAKLFNLVEVILAYDKSGPDILALQEVENLKAEFANGHRKNFQKLLDYEVNGSMGDESET